MSFKLAFAAAFVVAVTIAVRTARLASRQHGGTLSHLSNDVRGLVYIRAALGIVFYFALGAWLFWPRSLPWMYLPIPTSLRWLAVALLVPTLTFFAMSYRELGTNYRGGVGLYPEHVLVTSGPYRHVRQGGPGSSNSCVLQRNVAGRRPFGEVS